MLDLDQPVETRDGVTLARDDRAADVRLVFPPPPRVARRDGRAEVELLRFVRDGQLTGGHLSLAVEARHDEGALADVQRELREAARDERITLHPLTVLRGQAEVFFAGRELDETGAESSLLRRVYATTTPSLSTPHTARFSASLSADAVRLTEAALRSGGAPVGVTLRFEIEGQRAGQRVIARVDWSRAYEQLSKHARRGYLVHVDDLFALTERLVEQRVVVLDVVRGLDGETPGDSVSTALEWVQRALIERFCVPVLPLDRATATASLGDVGELVAVGADFEVKAIEQIERGVATFDLQQPSVVTRTITLQSNLRDLLGGDDADAHIADAGLDHPFFQRVSLHVRSARPLAASSVREVIGDWAYGATRAALRLTPEQPEGDASAWADADSDRTWTLQLDATLADDSPVDPGERVTLATQSGQEAELTLDLERLLGRRSVEVSMTPDPTRVLMTAVTLRHVRSGEVLASPDVMLTSAAPTQTVWLRGWRDGDTVEADVAHLLVSGQRVTDRTRAVETAAFRVPTPFAGSMTVELFAEDDWSELDRVIVEVQKREDLPSATVTFTQGGASAAVSLDMPDPTDRRFRYRSVRTWSDGRSEEDDWIETDVPSVLVGRVSANLMVVEIRPIGPELPTAGVRLIEVELVYADPIHEVRATHTAVIAAVADRPRWEVALRDPLARTYEYRITVYRTSGEKRVGPWKRTSDRIIAVPVTSA